ncbi:hypothetical protein V6N13_105714 [Hibiscus sabdariffa]|uniref:Uncharacterized protein n=1 Tax=Hibiscus sabdariffa TaxID=183260 RepID=A0ABR2EYJ2_9ROSI
MEVEVVVPLPTMEFNFDSSCSLSYITAPSSPQRCGGNLLLFIVPTNPYHNSYGDFNDVSHVFGADSPFREGVEAEYQKNALIAEIKATNKTMMTSSLISVGRWRELLCQSMSFSTAERSSPLNHNCLCFNLQWGTIVSHRRNNEKGKENMGGFIFIFVSVAIIVTFKL